MKKSLLLLVILMLALCLTLAACGAEEPAPVDPAPEGETPAEEQPAAPAKAANLAMATGGTSGTYYAFGGTIATILNNANIGVNINVNSTGASAENVQLISTGDAQLAILQNDVLSYSYNATGTWEGKPAITNTAVLACLYPEQIQVIALASSGIASVADLAGKNVSTGDIGSGVETNARQILAAYGLSFDDVNQFSLGFGDSSTAMQDGSLDAVFITSGAPNSAVQELAASKDIVVVPIDGAEAAGLKSDYPFYADSEITPEHYSFLEAAVPTLTVQATLICGSDMADETAYAIVKGIYDNAADIAASHPKGEYLTPDYAIQGVPIALHPGAVKYYEECGLDVSALK